MFESEAKALAVARANLERAVDQLAKANGDISNADQRIAALVARRNQITARRTGGDRDEADGADLASIAADLEGLSALRSAFSQGQDVATHGHRTALGAVSSAEWALARVQDQAAERALVAHADAVLATLGVTLAKLATVGQRLGRGQLWWQPEPVVAMTIHKADLQRAGVR